MHTTAIYLILYLLPLIGTQNHGALYFPEEFGPMTFNNFPVNHNPLPKAAAFPPLPPPVDSNIFNRNTQENSKDHNVANGISKLTLAINRALLPITSENRDNIVFAPMSIAGALALVLLGSNGKTYQELSSILGLTTGLDIQRNSIKIHEELGRIVAKLRSKSGFDFDQRVTFAAAIFVQNNYPIYTLYKEAAEKIYGSEVLNVDFEKNPSRAQQIVNAWVSDRTKGKIKDIIADTPSAATKIIIASAMYFKASWEIPFFEGSTAKRPFYPNGRKTATDVEVEMMANGGEFPYYKDNNLQCEIMGFPYKGNTTTMYVVMPFNSNTQKLREFQAVLTEQDLTQLADSTTYRGAVLLFPKMKIESSIDLKSALQVLGVNSLFNPQQANLGLISPGEGNLPTSSLKLSPVETNPLAADQNTGSLLIFSRTGEPVDCTSIFHKNSNVTTCLDTLDTSSGTQKIIYKKFGDKVGRRVVNRKRRSNSDISDNLKKLLSQQSTANDNYKPGLYADKVIHKVYMDITETGTEAAASTSVSLSRDGSRVTFRVDVPFFFFIRHEETKTILFWGSVNVPTPSFRKY